MRWITLRLLPLALGMLVGCGGSGRLATPTGTLTVKLGSDSLPGYDQAIVSIEKVEASGDGASWVPLGNARMTVDLMALQNGRSSAMLPGTPVAAGTYQQFRITWATVNYQSSINQPAYVIPTGGAGQVLTMPTTTVVAGPVTVPANGSATALLMLSAQQAVQSRPGGVTTFQATGQAFDMATSARITGTLSQGITALSGMEVFAETVDGSGLATLRRRALTDAFGAYTLEGLPTGSLYFVVAQPASAILAFPAGGADPVNAVAATTYTANLAFPAPQSPGALALTVTPASTTTQGTWGELRQIVATGTTGSQNLIVRSRPVVTGTVQDQVGFTLLYPGTYGVTAQRSTAGATPVMKTGTQVLVSGGATATSTLAYP